MAEQRRDGSSVALLAYWCQLVPTSYFSNDVYRSGTRRLLAM